MRQMKTKTVNLLDLSDSQKIKVLEQAKNFLRQQTEEARLCNSIAASYKIGPYEAEKEKYIIFS
jgi:hypothetical protein